MCFWKISTCQARKRFLEAASGGNWRDYNGNVHHFMVRTHDIQRGENMARRYISLSQIYSSLWTSWIRESDPILAANITASVEADNDLQRW